MIDANRGDILDSETLQSFLKDIELFMSQDELANFTVSVRAQALISERNSRKVLEEKLAWMKKCISNYLSEEVIDDIAPEYYKEWMRNVKNKVIGKIEE